MGARIWHLLCRSQVKLGNSAAVVGRQATLKWVNYGQAVSPKGAAVVAMSESSLQRKSRGSSPTRRGGGGSRSDSGPGGGGAPDDALRLVRERAADVAGRVISGTREVKEQVMQKAADLTRAVTEGVREEAEKFFD